MKKTSTALATLVALLAMLGLTSTAASATNDICVPKDAWTETINHPAETKEVTETVVVKEAYTETKVVKEAHWQRYSYNGPWESNKKAPPFPGSKWQANVKGDPHGVGKAGAYFRSSGNSGKGDWFYLEWVPEVTKTIEHPAVTKEVTKTVVVKEAWTETIEHPAVVCPDPEPEPEQPTYFLATSHEVACGEVTVTLRNVSPWLYRVLVEVSTDGGTTWARPADLNGAAIVPGVIEVDNRGEAPADQTGSYTLRFEEDSDTPLIRYRVSSGTESDLYRGLPVGEWTVVEGIETDCEPNIPQQPADEVVVIDYLTPPDCENPTRLVGSVTMTTPYVYDAESNTWVLGESVVTNDTRTEVSLSQEELDACTPEEEEPPAPPQEPQEPQEPTPPAPDTQGPPAAPQQPAAPVSAPQNPWLGYQTPGLADTGANGVRSAGLLAVAMTLIGGTLMTVRRRLATVTS